MPTHTITNERGETIHAYCGMCHQPIDVFYDDGELLPEEERTDGKWDIQTDWNPWLSLGIHIDHTWPFVTFHLPGILVTIGKLSSPALGVWSMRKWDYEDD